MTELVVGSIPQLPNVIPPCSTENFNCNNIALLFDIILQLAPPSSKASTVGGSLGFEIREQFTIMTELESALAPILKAFAEQTKFLGELAKRIEPLESRIGSSERRPAVAFSAEGGEALDGRGGGPDEEQHFESSDGFQFDQRRVTQRFSLGSVSSATVKDAGTKIDRPKFVVKKSKIVEGVKEEDLQDSDVLDYLDAYDHFFAMWKTVPANENLVYSNEARVPIVNLPPTYAKQICRRIKWVFDVSELIFGTVEQAQKAKFWKDLKSKGLRKALGELVEQETSYKGAFDALKRIKFKSTYGPIDMGAFATYQHDFKKEVLRLQSGGRSLDKIQLKDIIISAYPDRIYQSELLAKFGSFGVLCGDPQDFAVNILFEEIS